MLVNIEIAGRSVSFRLDWQHARWHALESLDEGVFPLIAVVDSRRYERYSDGSFAEVEK
jgi:hypothetical protein